MRHTAHLTGGDQLRLGAAALPAPGPDRRYEVWLTNAGRTQMYPRVTSPARATR